MHVYKFVLFEITFGEKNISARFRFDFIDFHFDCFKYILNLNKKNVFIHFERFRSTKFRENQLFHGKIVKKINLFWLNAKSQKPKQTDLFDV